MLLFDQRVDPGERLNVASENAQVMTRLRTLLARTRARGARFLDDDTEPPGS